MSEQFGTIEGLVESSWHRAKAQNIATGKVYQSTTADMLPGSVLGRNGFSSRIQRIPVGEYWVWSSSHDEQKEWSRVFANDVTVVDFRTDMQRSLD